jgi:chromosome segregation ATPase
VKSEFCFVSTSPQQQATMEATTLLRLKTEQEKMGRDERRQKDAARAIIELAKQKREEAQKPRGYTLQDNARLQMDSPESMASTNLELHVCKMNHARLQESFARLQDAKRVEVEELKKKVRIDSEYMEILQEVVSAKDNAEAKAQEMEQQQQIQQKKHLTALWLVETCLEKTREQLRVCTGEKEVLEILSREKQGELNAVKAKLEERCGELDAAHCKLARMQQENQALKDDLGKAHEASQALICLSKNATDELRFCREDKSNMMSKVQELQSQLEAVQKELELEKVCHKKLMDDCREREAAVEGVSKKIMEENRRCIEREAALQTELQKREAKLERTRTEWQNSNQGLEDMKRIETLGTHIKQLAETSREFRQELRVCTGEKEAMEKEINNLSRELEKAVSAKDNAEAKAQEAEHLVEKTREQLRVCTGEKKEMESLSRERQRALDVAQEEMELYQRQVNEREGALQKELQKCEAQLECTKTELQNLYKE